MPAPRCLRGLELGLNYIDTAPLYGHGVSEMRLGRVLKDVPRDSFVLSTKVGRVLNPVDSPPVSPHFPSLPKLEAVFDYSRDGILRSLEESLQRLEPRQGRILLTFTTPTTIGNRP